MNQTYVQFPASKPVKGHKAKFTAAEDARLRILVNPNGPNDWVRIAAQFPHRNPRQVKERWEYYLSPNVNNGPWSQEDDIKLLQKYEELGSKWTVIARFFPGRTNTNVKNRYLAMQREALHKKQQLSPPVTSPLEPLVEAESLCGPMSLQPINEVAFSEPFNVSFDSFSEVFTPFDLDSMSNLW